MKQKSSNFKVAVTNGIYLGIVLVFYSLILWILGVEREYWLQYLSFLIIVIGIFIAKKNWWDKYNEGFLTYGQAFSDGFLTILFGSILGAFYIYAFFEFIATAKHVAMLEAAEE